MRNAAIFMIIFLFSSCTTTQRRAFIRRDAGVDDYKYFPSRTIRKGSELMQFSSAPDPAAESVLENVLGSTDIRQLIRKTKTQALIVVKGSAIVLELYGKGYDRESTVTSFSVAKSFNSAMAGCLLHDGCIKSADEPVTDFVPELLERDSRFGKITIRHLLAMASGLVYEEKGRRADDTETYFNPDLRSLALTHTEIKEEPGIHFFYNNYNPLLFGLVVERAAGESVCSYMSRSVWSKIGAEADATWSLDSTEDGFEKMESGINARAIDFVRFACLYRDHGSVNGRQILNKEWIAASLSEIRDDPRYYSDSWGKKLYSHGGYYALGWYGMKRSGMADDFFAFGNKGQILYISPSADIVIARFGRQYGMNPWKYLTAFYTMCTAEASGKR